VATAIPVAGVFLERSALAAGFLAAVIAVGGFIGRALGQLDGARGDELQLSTTLGGTFGLCLGGLLLVIDAIAG
jgi:hypothetical protein